MGQLNEIGRGLRPRSTMTLRFLQARLKHYIICWDRLNFCYSEEFTKLVGCCRFNWRRIQSWHTKRSNINDKVNSRGRYKKRVKMISSLCQNNPAGRRGEAERIEQKQSFVQLKGEQARGGRLFWQSERLLRLGALPPFCACHTRTVSISWGNSPFLIARDIGRFPLRYMIPIYKTVENHAISHGRNDNPTAFHL